MALKVGAENKKKLYTAIALGAVVLLLAARVLFSYFGGSTPPPPPPPTIVAATAPAPAPATANAAAAAPYAHEAKQLPGSSSLDPTLHPEVMEQAEATAYTGTGRNIFSINSAAPTPVKIEAPVASIRPSQQLPPAPPPPPPIDLKFYGYSSTHGTQRQIFLLHGDDIFLAHEGDVVDRRYRVVAIRPMSVEVEDIPYHNTQSLPLTQN
jgi:hypothetical protein